MEILDKIYRLKPSKVIFGKLGHYDMDELEGKPYIMIALSTHFAVRERDGVMKGIENAMTDFEGTVAMYDHPERGERQFKMFPATTMDLFRIRAFATYAKLEMDNEIAIMGLLQPLKMNCAPIPETEVISRIIERMRMPPKHAAAVWSAILRRFGNVRVMLNGSRRFGLMYDISGDRASVDWDISNADFYIDIPGRIPLAFLAPENDDDFNNKMLRSAGDEEGFIWG